MNEKLTKKTYPFQKKGIAYIENKNGTCLLGDDMGLGKTIQAIGYIDNHPEFKNILIICPASLKLNWKHEIKKWINEKAQVINNDYINQARIKIINYNILQKNWKRINQDILDLIIGDEIHYIKNSTAIRTKYFKKIAKKSKRILALSGTPILNRPYEFWNILNLICPHIFNNWWQYIKVFCKAKIIHGNLDYKGCKNPEKLNRLLTKNCMIRRTKEEVLTDLPKKIKSIVLLEIDNKQEYSMINKNHKKDIEKQKLNFHTIEKLRQLSVKGKLNSIIEWIENFLETDKKLVIMANYHFVIDHLHNHFKNIAVKLDGRDTLINRDKAVNSFQKDKKIKLFIGNRQAAGVGYTLTAANDLCFCDFGWVPGENDQAMDRIHRISQKNVCNIYFFVGVNTIDELIISVLDYKKSTINPILNGKKINEKALLKFILEKSKKAKK